MTDWTGPYFDRLYLKRWPVGLPDDDVRRNAVRILDLLGARPGGRLLDVGCGQGRYPIAFAERGMRVTGLDASDVLLSEARRLAGEAGVEAEWVKGDMRAIPYRDEFDHAVLMDSFGFFETPAEDAAVLRGIAGALVPGGTFVLAVVNGRRLAENFAPKGREERDGLVVEIDRTLDGDVMAERLTIREGDRKTTGERRQRLYGPDELRAAAEMGGLRIEGIHGDMTEGTFAAHVSEKMVILAQKGEPRTRSAV